MKRVLASMMLVACLSAPAHSQTTQISLADAQKQANEISTRFNDSWNRHDFDGLASFFTPDAVFVAPTGKVVKGQEEVKQFFARYLNGQTKNLIHEAVVDEVRLLGPAGVWAIGHTTITSEGKVVGRSHWGVVYRVVDGHMLAEMLNVGPDAPPPPTQAQK